MISIVSEKKEAQKYIKSIDGFFDLYKSATKFNAQKNLYSSKFKTIVDNLNSNSDYKKDTLKGKILRENMLGDKTLTLIAAENAYSVAHVYNLKQKILREFAAIVFEVIII